MKGVPPLHPATAQLLTGLSQKLAVDGVIRLRELEVIVGQLCELPPEEPIAPPDRMFSRSDPLKRLLVRPFEHLLGGADPTFPRLFLPNYFEAVAAVGGGQWPSQARQCRAILRDLFATHGSALNWDHYYDDPRSAAILARMLAPVAQALATPDRRAVFIATLCQPVEGAELPATAAETLARVLAAAAGAIGQRTGRGEPTPVAWDKVSGYRGAVDVRASRP